MKYIGKDNSEYPKLNILPPLSSGKYIVTSGGRNSSINSLLKSENWTNRPSKLEISLMKYEYFWFINDINYLFKKNKKDIIEVYNPCLGVITGIFKLDNYMRVQFFCDNYVIDLFPIEEKSLSVKEGSFINSKTKIGNLNTSDGFANRNLHILGYTANSKGYIDNSPVALMYNDKFLTTGLLIEFL